MVAQVREFVIRQHVDAVLVNLSATNAARVGDMLSTALGAPRLTSGCFELWVTSGSRPT